MPARRAAWIRRSRLTPSCTRANRYGLASLCQLDKLPPKGAILIAAPLKIVKGTGSPLRVLALVPKK